MVTISVIYPSGGSSCSQSIKSNQYIVPQEFIKYAVINILNILNMF